MFGLFASSEMYRIWILLGDGFRGRFRVLSSLVQQWIQFMRQTPETFGDIFTHFPRVRGARFLRSFSVPKVVRTSGRLSCSTRQVCLQLRAARKFDHVSAVAHDTGHLPPHRKWYGLLEA